MIAPIYIVNIDEAQPFFEVWLNTLIGVLICWTFQTVFFTSFKYRGYSNVTYVIFLTVFCLFLLILTNPFVFQGHPLLASFSKMNIFLLRFSLISSINLIIYLILDLIYSREESLHLIRKNAMLEYNKLENDYKLLKAQINPHFLFNALNISKSLIKTQPKNAEKYIVHLSEFLRRSINNQQKSITLKKELAHCQQYIDLQKVRFEQAIQYQVSVEEIHLEKQLPFFSLITLVENAIKHNSFSEETPLKITVNVVEDFLYVKNNTKPKSGVVSTHTGLPNLNQRSKMLSNAEIKIDNGGQHFSVKVKLVAS